MDFNCKTCTKFFTTKANLERHEKTDKHLKCVACVSQPKITEFFVTEEKFAQHQEVVLVLSEKVSRLEMTTAELLEQTKSLHEQVSALTLSNLRLSHVAEIAELKLAHALELARASPAPAPDILALVHAQAVTIQAIQTKVDKPRHTAEENDQALIEKWFAHPRKYPEHAKKGEDYKSGFTDLVHKLFLKFKDTPTLDRADYADRLFSIFHDEIHEKTDNVDSYLAGYMELVGIRTVLQLDNRDDYKAMIAIFEAELESGFKNRSPG
jgi:hypothetical protein